MPEIGGQGSAGEALIPTAALDRRTLRRERRHAQVYEAAIELIVARGFDGTTMEEISQRADVARATVFNHFERKTAIIDEWAFRRREKARGAVEATDLSGCSVRQILEAYLTELARVSIESRTETVALMAAAVHATNVIGHPVLADEFASFFAQAKAEVQLPAKADPQLAGLLLATGYFAVLTAWTEGEPAPFDLRTRLLAMLSIILDGLDPAPAQSANPT